MPPVRPRVVKKGSKIWPTSAGAIPQPLSRAVRRRCSPSRRPDQLAGPVRRGADLRERDLARYAVSQLELEQIRVADDGGQHVAHVVGDAGAEGLEGPVDQGVEVAGIGLGEAVQRGS